MCQCFLARQAPASMRLREDALEAAEAEGVIIKTPTEGGPGTAENDLVVEALVLRELSHPNIIRLLGGGTTVTGGRCGGGDPVDSTRILHNLAAETLGTCLRV